MTCFSFVTVPPCIKQEQAARTKVLQAALPSTIDDGLLKVVVSYPAGTGRRRRLRLQYASGGLKTR